MGLEDLADLPAQPCLSSRIQTALELSEADLAFVDAMEQEAADLLPPTTTIRCRITRDGVVLELGSVGGIQKACAHRPRRRHVPSRRQTFRRDQGLCSRLGFRAGAAMTELRLDFDRAARTGVPEAALCEHKSAAQIAAIAAAVVQARGRMMFTRLWPEMFAVLPADLRRDHRLRSSFGHGVSRRGGPCARR